MNIAALRPAACRFCGSALSALDRHRGWCGATACRFKAGRERAVERRDAEIARRRRRAGVPDAVPVLWIEAHGTKLVPLPAPLRESYARHLAALATAPLPEAPPRPLPVEATPQLGRTCAFCRGRCCRYGAGRQAFVTGALLRRWLDAHPGALPAEAAADYLRRLPARHVENSCLHHGAQGCTLPAEMRSDICNQYLCAPVAQALPVHESVVAMEGGASGVQRAAWIADDTRTLPSR